MSGTNPVGDFLLTDVTSQTSAVWTAAIDGNFAVAERVADSFAPKPSASPAMNVVVDAGFIATTSPSGLQKVVEVAQQTVTITTAPAGPNNRIDLVVIDAATGTATAIAGTPATSPVAPAITAGKLQIAQISVPNGTTAIAASNITDLRAVWGGGGSGGGLPFAVASGSADVLTAAYTPPNGSLFDGLIVAVRAIAANTTTTPTLNVDGLGAKTITKNGGQALAAADIAGNKAELLLRYNSTGTTWELLTPKSAVTSVNGHTGIVSLASTDLTDTSNLVRGGNNITDLTNNASYTSVGGPISWFANNVGYLTSVPVPTFGQVGSYAWVTYTGAYPGDGGGPLTNPSTPNSGILGGNWYAMGDSGTSTILAIRLS